MPRKIIIVDKDGKEHESKIETHWDFRYNEWGWATTTLSLIISTACIIPFFLLGESWLDALSLIELVQYILLLSFGLLLMLLGQVFWFKARKHYARIPKDG